MGQDVSKLFMVGTPHDTPICWSANMVPHCFGSKLQEHPRSTYWCGESPPTSTKVGHLKQGIAKSQVSSHIHRRPTNLKIQANGLAPCLTNTHLFMDITFPGYILNISIEVPTTWKLLNMPCRKVIVEGVKAYKDIWAPNTWPDSILLFCKVWVDCPFLVDKKNQNPLHQSWSSAVVTSPCPQKSSTWSDGLDQSKPGIANSSETKVQTTWFGQQADEGSVNAGITAMKKKPTFEWPTSSIGVRMVNLKYFWCTPVQTQCFVANFLLNFGPHRSPKNGQIPHEI